MSWFLAVSNELARLKKTIKLKLRILLPRKLKIIIGAASTKYRGWISTDKDIFDVRDPKVWEKYFKYRTIDKLLAEHVFEHLEFEEAKQVFFNIHKYLKKDGTFRFAVPDSYHPSHYVRELTKPGGLEPGADDHKIFYNIDIVSNIAQEFGFGLCKIEYFDKDGWFFSNNFDYENGYISRCSKNYEGRFTQNKEEYKKMFNSIPDHLKQQFIDKNISYTSLLVDLIKR